MSHSYPSDISRGAIRPYSADVGVGPTPDQAPHRGLVRRFLRRTVPPEKRLPVANAARGLPRLAHLLPVFPAMERAAWPRSGFHSGASPKKNRLARPDKAMDGKRQTSFCIVDSQSVKNTDTAGHKGYDAGKKVSGIKRHIAVDTPGLPHGIHVTTADVTDRAGALAMFDRRRDGLSQVQNVLVDRDTGKPFATAVQGLLGASVEVVKRSELHTFVVLPKRWVVERSFAWLEKCRRLWKNCERKLNTSLQMVVLAFMVLILKRS